MTTNSETILSLLRQALQQAEIIPTFETPRGARQWMVNNQREYTIHYLRAAIEQLEAVPAGEPNDA